MSPSPANRVRTISLTDRHSDQPEDHILLSGDSSTGGSLVTAIASASGVKIQSWYACPLQGRHVSDPTSWVQLDEEETRALAAAMWSLVDKMIRLGSEAADILVNKLIRQDAPTG